MPPDPPRYSITIVEVHNQRCVLSVIPPPAHDQQLCNPALRQAAYGPEIIMFASSSGSNDYTDTMYQY